MTKLKQQCGGQFTSKMEGMVCYSNLCYKYVGLCLIDDVCMPNILSLQVTDLTLAREHQTNFEEYLDSNTHINPGIDLTVTVLTTGFWPSYKSFDLSLPVEMVRNFFHSKSYQVLERQLDLQLTSYFGLLVDKAIQQ